MKKWIKMDIKNYLDVTYEEKNVWEDVPWILNSKDQQEKKGDFEVKNPRIKFSNGHYDQNDDQTCSICNE